MGLLLSDVGATAPAAQVRWASFVRRGSYPGMRRSGGGSGGSAVVGRREPSVVEVWQCDELKLARWTAKWLDGAIHGFQIFLFLLD